jgi:sulfoxide reductase heme-binding subunit YedZ
MDGPTVRQSAGPALTKATAGGPDEPAGPLVRLSARRPNVRLTFTTRVLKPLGFLAALGPLGWLLWHGWLLSRHPLSDALGADPVKTIQVTTGLSTLILLFITLAVTPIRRFLHYSELIRMRRMAGLFAFFYALLHAVTYFVFDQSLSPGLIWADTVKHPRIAVGFAAFLLLIPLAVTSTDAMIRRLGKRWGRLHKLIYIATAFSVLHFLMVQKLDIREGLVYGAVFGALMLVRIRRKEPNTAGPA